MFPGQQGATWSSKLWQPRLGIKLLGAPSTEKWHKGVDFCVTSQRIGVISLVFAQSTERAQSGHINPATPVERSFFLQGKRHFACRGGRPSKLTPLTPPRR